MSKNLFQKMVEKDPSKYPARMGNKWDDDEVIKLLKSIKMNKSIVDIATEHERTVGAINSERRKLAADYWFNDNRPIEEIMKFTGLTKEEIEDTIKRRTKNSQCNLRDISSEKASKIEKSSFINDELCEDTSDMKEVISLLQDIQGKLLQIIKKLK